MDPLISFLFSQIDSPQAIAILLGLLLIALVTSLVCYVYLGFVFFRIGKRCKIRFPRLALIPFIGPMIVSNNVAYMSYYPWIALAVFVFGAWIAIFLTVNLLLTAVTLIAFLIFFVYLVIWNRKMFRSLKRPAAWAYSLILPPLYFIFVGIAARKSDGLPAPKKINNNSDQVKN